MEEKELVSVVIPSYNRAHCLEEAARSVLAQTYKNLELIIVDDGSTDDTPAVAQRLCQDARVRYIRQENAGACAARNHGVALAKGTYIAFHDSDDTWHPDKLEKQLQAMQAYHPDIVICQMNQNRADGTVTVYPKRIRAGFVSSRDDLFGIGTQTILARREVLAAVPFRPEMPRYQDLEWIYRALQQFTLYCVAEPLVEYTIGADSISKSSERMYQALVLLQQWHPKLRQSFPLLALHIMRNLWGGWQQARRQNPAESKKYLALMRSYWPGLGPCLRCLGRLKGGAA